HPHGRDLAMVGTRPVVLESVHFTNALQLAIPTATGGLTRRRVLFGGGRVRGTVLYPASDGVAVSVDGRPFSPNGDISYSPRGVGRIDQATGALEMLPGIPLGAGGFASPRGIGTHGFGVAFKHDIERTILPIRIVVQSGGRRLS